MVSLLAFPFYEDLPETFEALADSDFTVGFLREGDSALNFLKGSTHPVFVKLVAKMEVMSAQSGLDCLRRVIAKPKHSCIIYAPSPRYLIARNISDADARKLVLASETTYMVSLQ